MTRNTLNVPLKERLERKGAGAEENKLECWKDKKIRLERWSLDLKMLGALESYTKNRWSVEQRYVLEHWSAERKRGGALERYEKRAGALERCYPWMGPLLPCNDQNILLNYYYDTK